MSTSKQQMVNNAMAAPYGSPSAGQNARFQNQNPFEALTADPHSDGSGSTGSPTSSGGSFSCMGRNDSTAAPATPSRGQAQGIMLPVVQQLDSHATSSHEVRRMSANENIMSPSFTSPGDNRMQAAQSHAYGSPQRLINRRLSQVQGPRGLHEAQVMPHHESPASQTPQHSRGSSGRPSSTSVRQAPSRLNPAWNPSKTSMTAIPEVLAVQELAFRHGQQDRHVARDMTPSSPFAKTFDEVWSSYYKLGKAFGGEPVDTSAMPSPNSYPNYAWPILINPYTQNLDSPNGYVDFAWTRKICEMALNCMVAMIRTTCKRAGDWRKMVIDIPTPCQQALMEFPDLLNLYERLKRDGQEALNGGIPYGY